MKLNILKNGDFQGTPTTSTLTQETPATSVTADATTNLITQTAHGLIAGTPVLFGGTAVPTPLVAGVVYFVITPLTNTYGIAATVGGSGIDLTTAGTAVTVTSNPTDSTIAAALVTSWVVDANINDSSLTGAIGGDKATIVATTVTPAAASALLSVALDPRINGEAALVVKNTSPSGTLVHGPNTSVKVSQTIAAGNKLFLNGGNTVSFFVGSLNGYGYITYTITVGSTVLHTATFKVQPGWNYHRRDIKAAALVAGNAGTAKISFTFDDGANVALVTNGIVAITDVKIGVNQIDQDSFSAIERAALG